jgi:hypothetical protein
MMDYSVTFVNVPDAKLCVVTGIGRKLGEKLSRASQSRMLIFSRVFSKAENTQNNKKSISLSILQGAGLYPRNIVDDEEGYESFCANRIWLKKSISDLLSGTRFRRISSKKNKDRVHDVLILPAGENSSKALCHALEMYLKLLKSMRNPQTWDSSLEEINCTSKLLVKCSLLALVCCHSISFQRKVILLYFCLLGEIIVAMIKLTQKEFCRWIKAETTRVLTLIGAKRNVESNPIEEAIKELNKIQYPCDVLRICSSVNINEQSLDQVMNATNHPNLIGVIQQSIDLTDDFHDLVINGSIFGIKRPCNVFVQVSFYSP